MASKDTHENMAFNSLNMIVGFNSGKLLLLGIYNLWKIVQIAKFTQMIYHQEHIVLHGKQRNTRKQGSSDMNHISALTRYFIRNRSPCNMR